MSMNDDTPSMAVFCDFENVALGVKDAKYDPFDIMLVIERLLDKGKIVVKKAYADWERYRSAKRGLHEAAFELIEIPHASYSGKNSADIRVVVDALDLCYTKDHVDIFVIISGDSDFSPLVSKLRENAKTVIGLGVKNSSSELLIDNCDEFIFYDDLVREKRSSRTNQAIKKKPRSQTPAPVQPQAQALPQAQTQGQAPVQPQAQAAPQAQALPQPQTQAPGQAQPQPQPSALPQPQTPRQTEAESERKAKPKRSPQKNGEDKRKTSEKVELKAEIKPDAKTESEETPEEKSGDKDEALELVLDTVEALFRERDENLWGSMVKQTLKRKKPHFSEAYFGYRTFNQLLEDAERGGLLELEKDTKSGGYLILAFGPNA